MIPIFPEGDVASVLIQIEKGSGVWTLVQKGYQISNTRTTNINIRDRLSTCDQRCTNAEYKIRFTWPPWIVPTLKFGIQRYPNSKFL